MTERFQNRNQTTENHQSLLQFNPTRTHISQRVLIELCTLIEPMEWDKFAPEDIIERFRLRHSCCCNKIEISKFVKIPNWK